MELMNERTEYQINQKRILISQFGDEGVVFDLRKNEYLILNETMYRIVEGIQSGLSVNDICQSLQNEYMIEHEICQSKTEDAIRELVEREFILQLQK